MAAARVDLIPQVERGGGRLEHDPPLLLQAEAAHTRGGVETACPGQNLPGDSVRGPPNQTYQTKLNSAKQAY